MQQIVTRAALALALISFGLCGGDAHGQYGKKLDADLLKQQAAKPVAYKLTPGDGVELSKTTGVTGEIIGVQPNPVKASTIDAAGLPVGPGGFVPKVLIGRGKESRWLVPEKGLMIITTAADGKKIAPVVRIAVEAGTETLAMKIVLERAAIAKAAPKIVVPGLEEPGAPKGIVPPVIEEPEAPAVVVVPKGKAAAKVVEAVPAGTIMFTSDSLKLSVLTSRPDRLIAKAGGVQLTAGADMKWVTAVGGIGLAGNAAPITFGATQKLTMSADGTEITPYHEKPADYRYEVPAGTKTVVLGPPAE